LFAWNRIRKKADVSRLAELLEDLKTEVEKLNGVIRDQNLTPEEVIKMNTDRETLQRSLEDLRQKLDETKKAVLNLEVSLANRVTAVEEALDTYTGMLTALGLYPTPPEPWQDIDLTLELNSASSNPQQLLVGSDIRKIIRPTFSSVGESKRQERAAVEDESVKVNNELDQLTTESKNLDYEISEIETKVTHLHEQADDLRDVRSFFRPFFFSVKKKLWYSIFVFSFSRLRSKKHKSPVPKLRD